MGGGGIKARGADDRGGVYRRRNRVGGGGVALGSFHVETLDRPVTSDTVVRRG